VTPLVRPAAPGLSRGCDDGGRDRRLVRLLQILDERDVVPAGGLRDLERCRCPSAPQALAEQLGRARPTSARRGVSGGRGRSPCQRERAAGDVGQADVLQLADRAQHAASPSSRPSAASRGTAVNGVPATASTLTEIESPSVHDEHVDERPRRRPSRTSSRRRTRRG